MLRGDAQGLAGPARRQHGVAETLEQLPGQFPDRILVLHEEHGLGPATRRRDRPRLRYDVGVLLYLREVNLEGRAVASLAVDPDISAMLRDDAVGGRQPQPAALAHVLGREERFEQAEPGLFVHAAAGIAHGEPYVGPWTDSDVAARIPLVQVHVGGFD